MLHVSTRELLDDFELIKDKKWIDKITDKVTQYERKDTCSDIIEYFRESNDKRSGKEGTRNGLQNGKDNNRKDREAHGTMQARIGNRRDILDKHRRQHNAQVNRHQNIEQRRPHHEEAFLLSYEGKCNSNQYCDPEYHKQLS